ncbi:uncharacterized protein LOC121979359 [Zingiber officinale]|uniref:uncharacterized protein LOC121979359 n=1 Tax=Zingiber officinale TaxID=94328 RepID=UPI001C4CB1A4|nr:uncharacterized protein LOC121979359 [Zingiber officinale]
MTGNERRSEAESSPAAAAVARAGNVGADVVPAEEKGACVVIDVGRCSGKEADEDGGDREGESECRICQLSLSSGGEGSELILLGCGCKGELGVAHRHCAEAWFSVKGNRCCEICGAIAKNITVVVDSRVSEEGPSRGESNTRSPSDTGERIVCWRRLPVCNLLMACLIIAFILLWFFRVSMF